MQTKPRILIIDDEQDIIEVLSYMLKKDGMDVVSAIDGIEALKLLNTEKFSGVVSDLLMPNMDGLELLKILRKNKNRVPFIFLSGNATPVDKHDMINYGAYEVVHKPEIEKIPDALRKLFKYHQDVEKMINPGSEAEDFLDLLNDSPKK